MRFKQHGHKENSIYKDCSERFLRYLSHVSAFKDESFSIDELSRQVYKSLSPMDKEVLLRNLLKSDIQLMIKRYKGVQIIECGYKENTFRIGANLKHIIDCYFVKNLQLVIIPRETFNVITGKINFKSLKTALESINLGNVFLMNKDPKPKQIII